MRTAVYARYSAGPRQTDQSIEGQIRVCTDFCKQKNLTIVEVYADRHISGKTDDRPEFQRLIADSKKHKFEAVVVYKTDRFARNKYDSAIYKRQLKMNGIKIFYAAEAIPDGPEGIILESLMEGLAEYYSAELAQKIKRGMHESATKCKILGNSIPLGYRASKERTYEVDPDGAKVVQTIFDMYIKGSSNADICRYLNNLGIKTSRGNAFNKNSINRIISNEKYIGVYEAAGVKVEDGVPAIISKETFFMAQNEMAKKRTGKSKSVRPQNAEYLLSGKLFCGYCRKPMAGVSGTSKTGKKHYYYYCPTARAKLGCVKEHVRRDYIEDLVVQETVKHVLQPDVIADLAHKLWELQAESDNREEELLYYRKKLQENKKAIDNILKAVETGLGTGSLLSRLETLEQEQAAIQGEIAFQESRTFGLSEDKLLFFLESFLRDDTEWEAYKKRIIKTFVSEVYLYNDRLLIYYNISKGETLAQSDIELVVEGEVFDKSPTKSIFCIKYLHLQNAGATMVMNLINYGRKSGIAFHSFSCNQRSGMGFPDRRFSDRGEKMAKKNYAQQTEELLLPIAEKAGVSIYDVEYVKEGGEWYLRAYIDKPEGVSINDCETVSRALSDQLDQADFIEEAYILEVSSPGLGRTLKKDKHLQKSIGEEVEIRTYKPIDGQKEMTGILKAFDKETITLETDGMEKVLARNEIARIALALDF